MRERQNLYARQQNKRALERKERAKAKHFRSEERDDGPSWSEFTREADGLRERVGMVRDIRGRIIHVMLEDGAIATCTLAPGLPRELVERLVVGDRVILLHEDDRYTVTARAPRASVLRRLRGDSTRRSPGAMEEHVIAANIDVGVIVAAAEDPPFHPRFVDRYLIVCQNGGVAPLLCYNKRDLVAQRHPILSWYEGIGVPVVETSVVTGEGLEELRRRIHGKIAVLVGHSGVGKSSLVNTMIPDIDLATREVSAKTGRGKHTTTGTALYAWNEESRIIDTPGIRALGMEHLTREELQQGFPEFLPLVAECAYRNGCTHSHEPGCAVKRAVESGALNAPRYESYLRMLEE